MLNLIKTLKLNPLIFFKFILVLEACFKNVLSANQKYDNISIRFYSYTISPPPSMKNIIPSSQNVPLNYCSFFNNRAPSPQINLKNCTWYKENSCCLQSEIESTFSKVKLNLVSI